MHLFAAIIPSVILKSPLRMGPLALVTRPPLADHTFEKIQLEGSSRVRLA